MWIKKIIFILLLVTLISKQAHIWPSHSRQRREWPGREWLVADGQLPMASCRWPVADGSVANGQSPMASYLEAGTFGPASRAHLAQSKSPMAQSPRASRR